MTTIRRAAPDDIAAVAEVYVTSRSAAYPAIPASVHADDEVRAWVEGALADTTRLWVAENAHGEVVAMMALAAGWLEQLYVAPDNCGSGTGSALVAVAKRESPGGLQLWCFESNDAARRFYERHGFLAVERTDGAHNEEHAPDVRYVWRSALE